MTAATSLRWITRDVSRGGGIIGIQNNLLNKEWEDICQEKYTPYALTKETKIHGDMSAGEATSTGGRVIWIRVTGGGPCVEESKVGADFGGDMGVLSL